MKNSVFQRYYFIWSILCFLAMCGIPYFLLTSPKGSPRVSTVTVILITLGIAVIWAVTTLIEVFDFLEF